MKVRHAAILVFLILLLDQALKIWVKTNMEYYETIPLFGEWGKLHFVENEGMAFGLKLGGSFGKLFLSVFRLIAIAVIGRYLVQLVRQHAHRWLIVSIALILAGAVGNMIDSAFYGLIFNDSHGQLATLFPPEGGYASFLHGKVVDMFYFPMIKSSYPSWFLGGREFIFFRPIFNLADASITIGILIIIIFQRSFFKKRGHQIESIKEIDSTVSMEA